MWPLILIYTGLAILAIANYVVWRKVMSTSADLVTTATALSTAANALSATATAVESLITTLKTGQLIDQPTLDSVNTSLASSLTAIQNAQTSLQALVPTS